MILATGMIVFSYAEIGSLYRILTLAWLVTLSLSDCKNGSQLTLVDKETSGGGEPNAVAQHGNLVYVLNVGGSSNVVGFRLNAGGQVQRIPNSIRFLTTNDSEAVSLAFRPDGQFLLVTERATNNIDAFRVQSDGTLAPIVANLTPDPGAFSVSFAPNGAALVSETGPPGAVMPPLSRRILSRPTELLFLSAPESRLWLTRTAGMLLPRTDDLSTHRMLAHPQSLDLRSAGGVS
jgi:hypothetical protein